ncbi:unnamed protein product [Mytilus coruscus]|uniref:Endonuclease/exonuclease/phosphatase domain-containing protein n=1 Tax=Mytilus coruscus TaxID=42192 RepID=A0A6J8C3N9_MYTCO|nr:unnamed protein product [Mytilus coruscus]
MYLCSLLLTNSYAPEPNPGPRTPKYPCGTCKHVVTCKTEAVCCDSCGQWYYINCQQINHSMYEILGHSNFSWECINCGMPNFSTIFFNTTTETSNSYSELDISNEPNDGKNICPLNFTSSPLPKNHGQYKNHKNKTKPSAYYRPPSDKEESLENMGISLNTVYKKANANIWVSGDFNLGHINWEKNLIVPNKPDSALHQQLLNILDDNNLAQVLVINKKPEITEH